MRYLVTGGAGFIGSHLVDALLSSGEEVVVIDDLSTGSLENISHVRSKVEFYKADCSEVSKLGIKDLDGIFHLGIPSSSPMYRANRELTWIALRGFIAVAELAMEEGCKLVLASTSSVYNGNPIPWREDMKIIPTDFYSEVRYAMERLGMLYHDLYGLSFVALRYFSVYGEREKAKGKYANLVSQFLWAIMKDEPPVIYGDGTQTRDFIYVDDAVRATLLAMKSKLRCDVINVGYGKNYSLNELVKLINEVLGKNIRPRYVPNPIKNYVYHTLADTSLAEKKLGFRAKVDLKTGIEKLAKFYGAVR